MLIGQQHMAYEKPSPAI